jgi:acetoacetyl-CoA synthetase
VLPPDLFTFVYADIKSDVMLSSITGTPIVYYLITIVVGGTDIISLFAGGCPLKPVYAGQLQCVCLGMKVEAWSDKGEAVCDRPGDLVCTLPFPSMPVRFLNDDPLSSLYRKAYFDRFPGVWHHGDYITVVSKTKGLVMLGRSDGTLNPMGVRFGSSELYNLMAVFGANVEDSLAISYKRELDTDERLVLFVKMKRDCVLGDSLVKDIKSLVRSKLSPRHVPSFILQSPDIPVPVHVSLTNLSTRRMGKR